MKSEINRHKSADACNRRICLPLCLFTDTRLRKGTKTTTKLALASTAACCCGAPAHAQADEKGRNGGYGTGHENERKTSTQPNKMQTQKQNADPEALGARDPFDATSLRLMRIIHEKIRIKRSGHRNISCGVRAATAAFICRSTTRPRKRWRGPRGRDGAGARRASRGAARGTGRPRSVTPGR